MSKYPVRKVSKILITFFLCFSSFFVFSSVPSPSVTCIAVQPNGDVVISWIPPSDPLNEFQSYEIFMGNSAGGTFSLVGSNSTLSTNSFLVSGANANTTPKFFYVTTVSIGSVSSVALDTLRSIFLNVINPNDGRAHLQWNAISNPLPASASGIYEVYKEYPAGTFTLIANTSNLNFKDTISVCFAEINYRIEMSDASGCVSVSNISGSVFSDLIPPVSGGIDSVTVNVSGLASLGLPPSPSADAECRVIYIRQGTTWVPLDTTCGNTPFIFTYNASTATNSVETFGVANIDSCNNISIISGNQSTILLTTTYRLCEKVVSLTWTNYQNMKGGFKEYRIMRSSNGSPFVMVGISTANGYNDSTVQAGITYCYFIRAVNLDGSVTSSSNRKCITAKSQPLSSYIYLKNVSVNFFNYIELDIIADSVHSIRGIQLYKSTTALGPFSPLFFMPFRTDGKYHTSDNDVRVNETTYYYYAQVIDSCGLATIVSNTSKNVVLSAEGNPNLTNTLNFSEYESYLGNVTGYNVYRAVDEIFNPIPIAFIPFGTYTYIDDVSEFSPNSGKFLYYVEAVEGQGNPYGIAEKSSSNRAEAYQNAEVYIPNAFVPKGVNKVFLPITQFVEKTEYRLQIFNRWGQKIWETESDVEGWDGERSESDVYVYLVSFKNALGEYKEYKGRVTLIR